MTLASLQFQGTIPVNIDFLNKISRGIDRLVLHCLRMKGLAPSDPKALAGLRLTRRLAILSFEMFSFEAVLSSELDHIRDFRNICFLVGIKFPHNFLKILTNFKLQ